MNDPVLAHIVPAHGHAGLLPEAVDGVLAQRGLPSPAVAVVVDDGCADPATSDAASALAAAYPGRVFALRQRPRGLSAARNAGIAFALAAWPGLRAVHFLDADNRIDPGFGARALAALEAAPDSVGWVYPDLDEIGTARALTTAGAFSALAQRTQNACDAGSVVRRAVLERLRFDETLRAGFEDWSFWLAAEAAGWVGRHLPDSGFAYRRRPESMLRGAERDRAALLAALRERHPALYAPRALLRLEAAAAPRHAVFLGDGPVRWLTDPDGEGDVLTQAEAMRRWRAARDAPGAVHHPPCAVFADASAWGALREAGVLGCVLRATAARLPAARLVAIDLHARDEAEWTLRERPAAGGDAAALLVADALWLGRVRGAALARHRPARIEVGLPAVPSPSAAPRALLLATAAALTRDPPAPTTWREEWRQPRATAAARAYAAIGLGTPLPLLPPGRSIAFVVPLYALGGVEAVVTCQAAVLRARGWHTHLLVLGEPRATLTPAVRAAFASVGILAADRTPDPDAPRADAPGRYLGAPVSDFGDAPAARQALAYLAPFDAVVNAHAADAHPLMAPLRRLGVRTYASLHLLERDGWGATAGTPHAMLGWEGGYDGVLVISDALRHWALAAGIPPGKLRVLRNAPGYAAAPDAVAAAVAARAGRSGKLRALFLGRLDAQKGLDRLAAIHAETADVVEWRVVGRAVLDAPESPPSGLPSLPVEPPVTDSAARDALFAWADVLLLPSRFEGVPLAILEAQRFGCVPVATAVGAVAEAIADDADGVLLPAGPPEGAVLDAGVAALRRLAADRVALLRLARGAAARVAGLDWEGTMADWVAELERA